MYEIYTTNAFILSSIHQGESDLYVKFYTKDLGLIGVIVSGARKEISKHRYSVQPYSFASISVVKGKHGFRLTGVEHQQHLVIGQSDTTKNTVANVTSLILLLIHGQERDEVLFELLEDLLLNIDQEQSKKESEIYEIYIVVRLLDQLGYFKQDFIAEIPKLFFTELLPTKNDLLYIKNNKHTFIQYINKCIYETQL